MRVKKKNKQKFFFWRISPLKQKKNNREYICPLSSSGVFQYRVGSNEINTHCYAVNKRTVILRNNKPDNAL